MGWPMPDAETSVGPQALADEYGNMHNLGEELARGGQGVVLRTEDADLAIKQPLDASGQADQNANLRARFQNIRILPIPPRIRVSLPLAILRDEPGYVMRLLGGMQPFSHFEMDGKARQALEAEGTPRPPWLADVADEAQALRLLHYACTGSTRRRLSALAQCASLLARLHGAGLVYGDISANNAFLAEEPSREVWLIDADNLRFELPSGGISVYTPSYGAPEVVRGTDASRPRSDCWAFSVLAFKLLALAHPFLGQRVDQADDGEEGGWDAEPSAAGTPADLQEQAYAGQFPFVDDQDDAGNRSSTGLPRALVATPGLRLLFQETFGAGRLQSHRRPPMFFWALELAKAFDLSLDCPACAMSYFADEHPKCPYCGTPRPAFLRAKTPRWEVLLAEGGSGFDLPHRLFHPFSFEHNDDPEGEAVVDFGARTVVPVRGAQPFPDALTFAFVEAEP